jgi:hypothetical protein
MSKEELEILERSLKDDDIVTEVRRARDAYAARFGYDLDSIFEDLERKAAGHPERLAALEEVLPAKGRGRPPKLGISKA